MQEIRRLTTTGFKKPCLGRQISLSVGLPANRRNALGICLLACVTVLLSTSSDAKAQANPDEAARESTIENLILVTLDGLRWQELFYGAESGLMNSEIGNVRDVDGLRANYWRNSQHERRKRLMPFFWRTIATQGRIYGNPERDSIVRVTNKRYFSYPGYSELLCGIADDRIDSNDKKYNPNRTVLAWLNEQDEMQDGVAAFTSWDVFPYIINSEAKPMVDVNAGWTRVEPASTDAARLANRLHEELPQYWPNVRFDTVTTEIALDELRTEKRTVIYLGLGETDDWAHAGRYDLYLDSANYNDRMIQRIWETAQSLDRYRNRTAMLITTDHGRGDGRESWKSHGADLPESDRIWIALIGPGIEPADVSGEFTQSQVAATVARLLGYDYRPATHDPAPPLPITR